MQKVLSFIKKRKKPVIFVLLIAISLVAGLLFASRKQQPTTPILTPTPPPFSTDLNLSKILPPGDTLQTVFSATAILYFDEPLDLLTAEVTINPKIDIIIDPVRNNTSGLAVRPASEWKENINYEITIKKGLVSLDGKKLQEDIVHKFTFEFPEDVTVY
jgi:hypothetical protein